MTDFLPFALPDIEEEEIRKVIEVLRSGWLTTGPKVKEFEEKFAQVVGSRYAVAVNSCTAALHLALEAIGLKEEDEVITTPYTFAATAEVVRYFKAKPVFVDICPDDFNIDPEKIESAITNRTKAIIPVHIAGLPADLEVIADIASKYNLAVIEDAAHAFPSKYKGLLIGSPHLYKERGIKHAICFSFYATKTITTGEGGMLCTDDDEIAERCRIMRLHGISKDAWKRYTAEGSWYYEIIAPGYKYNMTDIAAAMGIVQLTKAEHMRKRRKEIADHYNRAFKDIPQLQIPYDNPEHQHAWHLYMLRLNLEQLRIDRTQFIEEMKKRGIGTSVHFIPLHIHPYYRETFGYRPEDFPVAYREYLREVSLPIYSKMSNQDVDRVINAVVDIVKKYSY